jgi:hypothetical protein
MSLTPAPVPRGGLRSLPIRLMLLVALASLVIACTGTSANPDGVASLDDPSAAPSSGPEASLDPEEAMLAFAQCMRDHGIDMPDPQVSGDGETGFAFRARPGAGTQDFEELQAAHEACQQHLPQGGPNGRPAQIDPEMEQQLLDFARCMRDNGIDFPDPQFGSGGFVQIGGGGEGPKFDPESEEFQAAMDACGENLPGGGPGFSVGGANGNDDGPSTNEDTETP